MEKMGEPPAYNEVFNNSNFPSAPPIDQNDFQKAPMYPNINQQTGWNQQPIYPQGVYNQPLIQQPTTFIQQRPVVIINQQVIYGEDPLAMTCPSCQQQIVTRIEHHSNVINHSIALGLCLVGFFCGCCLIPYCIDSLKDVTHKCGKCGVYLGTYRRGRV